jgi:hypothetical protein
MWKKGEEEHSTTSRVLAHVATVFSVRKTCGMRGCGARLLCPARAAALRVWARLREQEHELDGGAGCRATPGDSL